MSDTKIYLGIEVGDTSLKLALLDSAEKRVLKTAVLATETSPINDIYTFEMTLQEWFKESGLESVDAISVSIPAFRSIVRQVYVPAEACAQLADYLEWYLELITNAEKGSYVMDYKVLSGDPTVGETVLLIAVRREWVDGLRKGFRTKAFIPKTMEVDVLSLMNLMDSASGISSMECVMKADGAGVTLMWLTKDNLQALRCVSTLSLANNQEAADAFEILAEEIKQQIEFAKEDNSIFEVSHIRVCGELTTYALFMESLRKVMPDVQISLMDSYEDLRLPVEAEDSVAVPVCAGAIGAALNLMEGV